jgi:periplasmic protein TonB
VNLSLYHWVSGAFLAVGAHALAFAAMGQYEQPAMIERASGPVLSVAGSLSNYSIDAQEVLQSSTEAMEEGEEIEELEPETIEEIQRETVEIEPAPLPIETATSEAPPVQVAEPVEAENIIPTAVLEEPKPQEPIPEKIEEKEEKRIARLKPQPKELQNPKKKIKPIPRKKTKVARRINKKKKGRDKARRGRRRSVAGRRGGGGGGRASAVAGRATISNYKGRVRARIAGRARSARGRGMVVVQFTVTSRGGVTGVRILRSANTVLNNAALRAVRGGFPPIPRGGPRHMTFTIPISFR